MPLLQNGGSSKPSEAAPSAIEPDLARSRRSRAGLRSVRLPVVESPVPRDVAARTAGPNRDRRRLLPWLVGSLSLHAILALLLSTLPGPFGPGSGQLVDRMTLTATLSPSPTNFTLPDSPQPSVPIESPAAPAQADTAPLPLAATPRPRERTPGGQVTINRIDASEPLDPAFAAVLRQFYPGAAPAEPEFDVPPAASYPKAALAGQRNVQLRVLVVMHDDGRVELARGSLHDPLFAPSVRAALASARVPPAAGQGRPAVAWAVLLFVYEFVGT